MNLDWTTIVVSSIGTIFGGTFIWTLVSNIRYRKQDKRQKEAETQKQEIEVKDNNIESQKKEMELIDLYKDKVFELVEQVYAETKKNGLDNNKILKNIEELSDRVKTLEDTVKEVKEEQQIQTSFLNGELSKYKELRAKLNK